MAGAYGSSDFATTVYDSLRAIAQRQMEDERTGHTLTATALVHEAYLRLASFVPESEGRAAYFQAAAQAMRRILIDHARKRGAAKRGGGKRAAVEIESVLDLAEAHDLHAVLALDEAVSRLESDDAEAASVVRLRFFAGLTGEEAAEVLHISPRQVDRDWAYARAFLLKCLREGETNAS